MTTYPGRDESPAPLTGSIASIVRQMLAIHDKSAGVGVDHVDGPARVHPMAEAKYLSTVATLVADGLWPADRLAPVSASLARLQDSASLNGERFAWGLNFEWKDGARQDPYVITTALAVRALSQVRTAMPGLAADADAMLSPALAWLTSDDVLVAHDGLWLPVYGSSNHAVVDNVVAQWAAALHRASTVDAHRDLAHCAAGWVAGHRISGAGWTYSQDNPVVDLVHTAYIAEGLWELREGLDQDLDLWLAEALLQFGAGAAWRDTCRWLPSREALDVVRAAASARIRVFGDHAAVGFTTPARDWSMGALLSVACDLEASPSGDFWFAYAGRIAKEVVNSHVVPRFPRHAMHVAEGLAKYSVLQRSRTTR